MKTEKTTTFALKEAEISALYNGLDEAVNTALYPSREWQHDSMVGFKPRIRQSVYTLLKNGGFIDVAAYMLHQDLIDENPELKAMRSKIDGKIKELETSIDQAAKKIAELSNGDNLPITNKKHTKDIYELKYYILAAVISLAAAMAGLLRMEEMAFKIIGALGTTGAIIFPALALYSRTVDVSKTVQEVQNEEKTKVVKELSDALKDNLALLKKSLNKFEHKAKEKVLPLDEALLERCASIVDDLETKDNSTKGRVYAAMEDLGIDINAYNANKTKELARLIDIDKTLGVDRIRIFLDALGKELITKYEPKSHFNDGILPYDMPSFVYEKEQTNKIKEQKFLKHMEEQGTQLGEGKTR